MQNSCQIPTPIEYVNRMLDVAGYTSDLYGKRILENSCGDGNILCEIVCRYIADCKKQGHNNAQISSGLSSDIVGYETDSACAERCISRLNSILIDENLPPVRWNIHNVDYLKADGGSFDFVVGNPPYITYHDLDVESRTFLRNHFDSCKAGRFDYFYAFTEKAYASLNSKGTMVYLVPFGLFRNKFADFLRDMLKEDIVSILDCSEREVFGNVTTSVAIITVVKGSNSKEFYYRKISEDKGKYVDKTSLSDKWFFNVHQNHSNDGLRFGDYFVIKNSVATLCNKAFLITEYEETDAYYVIGDQRVEKDVVRQAVSAKSCKKKTNDMIIFPYKKGPSNYEHFSDEEFHCKYPEAYEYIRSFADNLSERKKSDGVLWFEYGRTQAINDVDGEKLIMPMVVTTKVTAYKVSDSAVPYAGYFIKQKDGSSYNLEFAKTILESDEFYEYVKTHGTPTTDSSYRISVKEIENYTIGGKQHG